MKFLEKRWVLIILAILFSPVASFTLFLGLDAGMYSEHFFYFAHAIPFLAGTYFLYRLINVSRWNGT